MKQIILISLFFYTNCQGASRSIANIADLPRVQVAVDADIKHAAAPPAAAGAGAGRAASTTIQKQAQQESDLTF